MIKYKVKDAAADFGVPNKTITEILKSRCGVDRSSRSLLSRKLRHSPFQRQSPTVKRTRSPRPQSLRSSLRSKRENLPATSASARSSTPAPPTLTLSATIPNMTILQAAHPSRAAQTATIPPKSRSSQTALKSSAADVRASAKPRQSA